MSDWEIVDKINSDKKSTPSSDWNIVPSTVSSQKKQSQETFGQAALKAPYRIGEDVYKSGFNLLKNIPGYLESAKTEIPAAIGQKPNPLKSLSQVGAGLTETGHGLLNAPHDIANYLSNRLNLVPQSITDKIPYQKDISKDINQTFGEAKEPGQSLIRGIGRNALNLLGGYKGISALNPMNLTASNIAKNVIKTGEKNKKTYSNLYNNLFDEAKNKGYSDMSHVIPNIDIKNLRKYSQKKSIDSVEDFLKNPTFENAHWAKSDLSGIKRQLEKNVTLKGAERKQFDASNNAIKEIETNMFKNKEGKIDNNLSDKYKNIQKGFMKDVLPYRNKAITAYKRNEMSPKELISKISHGEFMAKAGDKHPEIKIRKSLLPFGAGAIAATAGSALYDKFRNSND